MGRAFALEATCATRKKVRREAEERDGTNQSTEEREALKEEQVQHRGERGREGGVRGVIKVRPEGRDMISDGG